MENLTWFSRFQEAVIATLSGSEKPADRVSWVGRDPEGHRFILTDTGNGRWIMKFTDGREDEPYSGQEVGKTEQFIEIQLDTGSEEDRARIYKDKLLLAAKDGPRGWLEMAKGRWIQ